MLSVSRPIEVVVLNDQEVLRHLTPGENTFLISERLQQLLTERDHGGICALEATHRFRIAGRDRLHQVGYPVDAPVLTLAPPLPERKECKRRCASNYRALDHQCDLRSIPPR
jgi:hypothetical protein